MGWKWKAFSGSSREYGTEKEEEDEEEEREENFHKSIRHF